MSMESVSGDIFSILRKFATPTMGGTYTNSNAPRPMPPKAKAEANTDAARAMSDPTRYGATGSDAGAGLVPQPPTGAAPPQPVATRVIPGRPPAPAARPSTLPVQPDVDTTGAVPAPTDGSRATALVNAPDGQVPAGGGGGEFDFITQSPLYRFMQIEAQKKKAEADRQRSMDNIFFGLSKAVGGFTGTPVETGQAGARGGSPSGDPTLTFENLKDLQSQKLAAENMAAMRQVADQIVKENPGMSRAAIEAQLLAKSDEFGKLGYELASPKAKADLKKTIVDTLKVQVDTEKGVQELVDPSILSDEQLIQIGRMTNQPNPTSPETIQTLRSMGPQGLAKMVADVAGQAAGVAQPRVWEGDEIKTRQAEREKLGTSLSQIPQLSYLRDLLDDKRGGSVSADTVQKIKREIGYLVGIDPSTMSTEQYEAAIQPAVQKVLKTYGSNASTPDLMAAQKSFGEGLNPETAKRQLGLLAKTKIWDVIAHNEEVERMASHMTEGNAAGLRAQRRALPPPDENTLRLTGIAPDEVEALRTHANTPLGAELRKEFQKEHGKHMVEWVLGEVK
jgi:hypothetical protein